MTPINELLFEYDGNIINFHCLVIDNPDMLACKIVDILQLKIGETLPFYVSNGLKRIA